MPVCTPSIFTIVLHQQPFLKYNFHKIQSYLISTILIYFNIGILPDTLRITYNMQENIPYNPPGKRSAL